MSATFEAIMMKGPQLSHLSMLITIPIASPLGGLTSTSDIPALALVRAVFPVAMLSACAA